MMEMDVKVQRIFDGCLSKSNKTARRRRRRH